MLESSIYEVEKRKVEKEINHDSESHASCEMKHDIMIVSKTEYEVKKGEIIVVPYVLTDPFTNINNVSPLTLLKIMGEREERKNQ